MQYHTQFNQAKILLQLKIAVQSPSTFSHAVPLPLFFYISRNASTMKLTETPIQKKKFCVWLGEILMHRRQQVHAARELWDHPIEYQHSVRLD